MQNKKKLHNSYLDVYKILILLYNFFILFFILFLSLNKNFTFTTQKLK